MADQDEQASGEGVLTSVAKSIGRTAGKIAHAVGVKTGHGAAQSDKPAPEDLYRAEYVGSGTFIIRKPKRKAAKLRQSRLKGRRAGARK